MLNCQPYRLPPEPHCYSWQFSGQQAQNNHLQMTAFLEQILLQIQVEAHMKLLFIFAQYKQATMWVIEMVQKLRLWSM